MPKKTKVFILFLLILVFILFLSSLFFSKKMVSPPSFPPSPTPIPEGDNKIIEYQQIVRQNKYPLIDQTPYKTSLFEVSYVGPLKLKVVMFDKNKERIKSEVEKWMRENGVNPESHQAEYVLPPLP